MESEGTRLDKEILKNWKDEMGTGLSLSDSKTCVSCNSEDSRTLERPME